MRFLPLILVGTACASADFTDEWLQRSNGVYSLHEAAAAGNTIILRQRIEEGGDVNAPDEQGNAPLHLAASCGHTATVKELISAGADPLITDASNHKASDCSDSEEIRELCIAAEKRRMQEIEASEHLSNGRVFRMAAALEHGVSANAQYRDNSGPFLMQAVRESRPHMVRLLIRHGADVNASIPGGESILHAAALQKNPWIVQDLLTAGANPMAQNDNMATPLHEAVWAENLSAVRILLPAYKGCNYSPDGAHNGTPLHLSIVRRNMRLVQMFLEAGINFNHPAYAQTPLLPFAAEKGTPEITELLRAAGAK